MGSKKMGKPQQAKAEVKKKIASNPEKRNSFLPQWFFIWAFFICLVTFVVYQQILDHEFVDWDDTTYVVDNPLVRNQEIPVSQIFNTPVSLNYHPITILTMRWNANECKDCLHGISAAPFLRWNLLIHLFNCILVLYFAFLLSQKNIWVSLFTTLIFAVHPMHVESVAWVSERKDVLYVMFFLLGLISYLKVCDNRKQGKSTMLSWFLVFLFFILSCLSKAMAVVFPLVLILIDYYKSDQKSIVQWLKSWVNSRVVFPVILMLGISMFFGIMASDVQAGGDFYGNLQKSGTETAINKFDTFSLIQRFHFASYGFMMYLIKFFVPVQMCTFYPYPTELAYQQASVYWIFLFLTLGITGLALFSLNRYKIIAFGIGFYFVTVALVLQFVSVGVVIMADRYTYLPYLGVAFLLSSATSGWLEKMGNMAIYMISALLLLVLGYLSFYQIKSWKDSESLWGQVITLYPKQEQPYSIRGNYYGKMASKSQEKQDFSKQIFYIEKAAADFGMAITLQSKRADVFEGMGNIFGMRSKPDSAIVMYNQAIQLDPKKASVYINRGIAKSLLGRNQESLQDMIFATQLEPKPIHILYRGIAKQSNGDIQGAKTDYQEVLRLEPGNKQAIDQLNKLPK